MQWWTIFSTDLSTFWEIWVKLHKVFEQGFYSALSWLFLTILLMTKLYIRNAWVIKFLSICVDLMLSLWSETHLSVKNSNILKLHRLTVGCPSRIPDSSLAKTIKLFTLLNGILPNVIISHMTTPKLQMSDACVKRRSMDASGAVHLIAIKPPWKHTDTHTDNF